MADLWLSGKLTPVFTPVGKRNEEMVYRRAPFDLLEWTPPGATDPEVFVNTVGFETLNSTTLGLLDDGDAIGVGHEFGFYVLDQYVLEQHQGDGNDDDWHSLHTFGYV